MLQIKKQGQSLVEVLIAIGLLGILLPVLATSFAVTYNSKPQRQSQFVAQNKINETIEKLYFINSNSNFSFNSLIGGGYYYIIENGNTYQLTSGSEIDDFYTTRIEFFEVQRDSSFNIGLGFVDKSTVMATVEVLWTKPTNGSLSRDVYLTRYVGNEIYQINTQNAFNLGIYNNTEYLSGVVLSQTTGSADWSNPTSVYSYNAQTGANGNSVYKFGDYVILVRDNSGGDNFYIFNVSDPTNPTIESSIDTNDDIYDVVVVGNYAYLATDDNSGELQVYDISNVTSPSLTASLNLNRNNDASSLYIVGSTLYLVRQNQGNSDEFYTIDISNPSSPSVLDSADVGDDANDVVVIGNYAYIVTSDNNEEIVIYNISNPSNITYQNSYNLPGSSDAFAVSYNTNALFVGTQNNGGGDEFYSLNYTNPTNLSIYDSYDVTNNVNTIFVDGDSVFLGTNENNEELIIIDASVVTNLSLVTNFEAVGDVNGVFVDGEYAYLATDGDEFEVVEAQSGPSGYQTSGTWESQSIDMGSEVAFNYLTFSLNIVPNTNLQLQIATNNDNSTFNFVGPDGTSSTYFTTPGGAFNLQNAFGRYIKIKAFYTSDGSNTPTLQSINFNYTP